jgi:hypothetical protein
MRRVALLAARMACIPTIDTEASALGEVMPIDSMSRETSDTSELHLRRGRIAAAMVALILIGIGLVVFGKKTFGPHSSFCPYDRRYN